MARTSNLKAKEPIKLREKMLSNGSKSLYLDIYQDGKRNYEFLKLYIIPEKGSADRATNKNTYQLAETIKAQKIADLYAKKAGVPTDRAKHILLIDWVAEYERDKAAAGSRFGTVVKCLTKVLKEYSPKTKLYQADKQFLSGFINHISTRDYSKNYKSLLWRILTASLKYAVQKELLPTDPTQSVENKPTKENETERTYLTAEELKKLEQTPSAQEELKRAFLFSCFTGLRISDIRNLQYSDIYLNNGKKYMSVTMEKTRKAITIPIGTKAEKYLSSGIGQTKVFNLCSNSYIGKNLEQWAKDAGIDKHITFHSARHTFATLSMTSGAPIEVVSDLLGHANIKTTQIYAKVVDSARNKAIEQLDAMLG